MAYQAIRVEKLTPIIGAEVHGVDLSKTLDERTFKEIHEALTENQVIFFRDQHLTVDQHKAFGRLFGELVVHPAELGGVVMAGEAALLGDLVERRGAEHRALVDPAFRAMIEAAGVTLVSFTGAPVPACPISVQAGRRSAEKSATAPP